MLSGNDQSVFPGEISQSFESMGVIGCHGMVLSADILGGIRSTNSACQKGVQ